MLRDEEEGAGEEMMEVIAQIYAEYGEPTPEERAQLRQILEIT
ncbi:MAG: hypothetical protein ACREN8_12470 [Candidatus Dormibacteraceae bacterium]